VVFDVFEGDEHGTGFEQVDAIDKDVGFTHPSASDIRGHLLRDSR